MARWSRLDVSKSTNSVSLFNSLWLSISFTSYHCLFTYLTHFTSFIHSRSLICTSLACFLMLDAPFFLKLFYEKHIFKAQSRTKTTLFAHNSLLQIIKIRQYSYNTCFIFISSQFPSQSFNSIFSCYTIAYRLQFMSRWYKTNITMYNFFKFLSTPIIA